MDWKQIETRWAAMARRIRADVQCGKAEDIVLSLDRVGNNGVSKTVAAKRTSTVNTNSIRNSNSETAP